MKPQWNTFILITPLVLSFSCAGPMSPFGGLGLTPPEKEVNFRALASEEEPFEAEPISISFSPKRQNLHETNQFTVEIFDPNGVGPLSQIQLYYNQRNVTDFWLSRAQVFKEKQGKRLFLKFEGLKLPAARDHQIIVRYQHGHANNYTTSLYELPECSMAGLEPLGQLSPFSKEVTEVYEPLIEGLSSQEGVNPSLVAGLIAQESAFNPKAVSFAKAIGLTQVTNGAAEEITDIFDHFPVYPKLDDLPVPMIKSLIISGKLNEENEWRLHPRYSILGGIHYLKRLEDYWYREETQKLIHRNYPHNGDDMIDDIILASYNSGPFRVKQSLKSRGQNWLNAKDLSEAKKYVRKVKSYCYHFASNHQ